MMMLMVIMMMMMMVIDRFYIALVSALEQTYCVLVASYLKECSFL